MSPISRGFRGHRPHLETARLPPGQHVVDGGRAWIASEFDSEPLHPEHDRPARLLVGHPYFWKSAKWVGEFGDETRASLILGPKTRPRWNSGTRHISQARRAIGNETEAD